MCALRISLMAVTLTALAWRAAAAAEMRTGPDGAVTFAEQKTTATLANGWITAVIHKATGKLVSLKSAGVELLGPGNGYWDCVGDTPQEAGLGRWGNSTSFSLVRNPVEEGGALVEIATRLVSDGSPGVLPLDVEIRYLLRRGESGLRTFAVFEHRRDLPALALGQGRLALKLNPRVFDFLSVDETRQRRMPSGEDWDRGTPLNLKEARRLTTGIHAGEVEHKYDYSAPLAQTKAWGWSSTRERVGLWIINPSAEYLSGGPPKIDLTGHLDANQGGAPVLMNMWQSGHYGGRPIHLAAREPWRKVIGPFLLYANRDGDAAALWRDALARAEQEQAAWPPAWMAHPEFPAKAERGAVRGQLVLRDPQAPGATAAGAWVGLAPPPYAVEAPREKPRTFDWQLDGKHYQHWVRADAEGRFHIANARAGRYQLCAFVDGVLGEFHRADVGVKAGESLDLGRLEWTPERAGRLLWEIGIPNRSAAEFRHGDEPWKWGLYLKYLEEFPADVNFIVGKSDWRRDWNYCQPPRLDPQSRVLGETTWSISFDLPEVPRGAATLRLVFCGSRERGRVFVTLNDQRLGDTGSLPENGVMHRDGLAGHIFERKFTIEPARLKTGRNVIRLRSAAQVWHQAVLYDYLRLEAGMEPAGVLPERQ